MFAAASHVIYGAIDWSITSEHPIGDTVSSSILTPQSSDALELSVAGLCLVLCNLALTSGRPKWVGTFPPGLKHTPTGRYEVWQTGKMGGRTIKWESFDRAGRFPLQVPVPMKDVIVEELLLNEKGSLFVRYFIAGEGAQC